MLFLTFCTFNKNMFNSIYLCDILLKVLFDLTKKKKKKIWDRITNSNGILIIPISNRYRTNFKINKWQCDFQSNKRAHLFGFFVLIFIFKINAPPSPSLSFLIPIVCHFHSLCEFFVLAIFSFVWNIEKWISYCRHRMKAKQK